MYEAISGAKLNVPTLDGRQLSVDLKNVNPDTVKILPAEGMPNRKVR